MKDKNDSENGRNRRFGSSKNEICLNVVYAVLSLTATNRGTERPGCTFIPCVAQLNCWVHRFATFIIARKMGAKDLQKLICICTGGCGNLSKTRLLKTIEYSQSIENRIKWYAGCMVKCEELMQVQWRWEQIIPTDSCSFHNYRIAGMRADRTDTWKFMERTMNIFR